MSKPMTKENLVNWLEGNKGSYGINDVGQITVKHNLGEVFYNWVKNQGYTSLPDELVGVQGDLWLGDTQIENLGGLTFVGGWFSLRGTPITNLGGLTAVRDLLLSGMKNSYFDLSPIESGKCKVNTLTLGEDTLYLLTQTIADKVGQVDFYKKGDWRTLSKEKIQEIVKQNEYNKAKESAVDTIDDSYMDDLREWGER